MHKRILLLPKIIFLLAILFMGACSQSGGSSGGGASASGSNSNSDDLPGKSLWESHMRDFGMRYCNEKQIKELSTWEGSVWYYDGMRIYYQIADYTGDSTFNRCAGYVREVYRPYILDNNGVIPGWRVFPIGLEEDFYRTGDHDSRKAALLLAKSSAFAASGGGESFELSRETAYLIHAYLTAENLGEPHAQLLERSVAYALGHLNQWTGKASYIKPFMVGLTFEALIRYNEQHHKDTIQPAITRTADWLWNHAWDNKRKAFPYIICRSGASNPECKEDHSSEGVDLNLLIAPAYAWLYSRTGDPKYADQADLIFKNGVEKSYLGSGKHFSQNYRWSFDYVKWRTGD